MRTRKGPRKYYRGTFFIVFYDEDDEYLMNMFDNVKEILHYQHKQITRQNVNLINVELLNALQRESHKTTFLDGRILRVYIIKLNKEER